MPNYNSKTPLEETFDKSNIFSKVDNSNTELSFTQPERTIPAEVIPSTSTKEKKKQIIAVTQEIFKKASSAFCPR